MIKSNNRATFDRLRTEYPVLFYNSYHYSFEGNKIKFSFEFQLSDTLTFRPSSSVTIPHFPQLREQLHTFIDNMIFQLGMIELVSYWKSTCSPTIIVKAGMLDDERIDWWKDLYYNGLGEFFYLNSIETSISEFVTIKAEGKQHIVSKLPHLTNEYIVPVGGGKDSSVSLELLKKNGELVHPLIMNPRGATVDTVEAAGLQMDDVIIISRVIDPLLLQLNEQGFLNGHTPFSAMLAFYTLLASGLTGYKHIALSNESSANEATIPGTTINHQYSKSIDFETKFRDYYSKYISPELNYFSFLRPLNELQIVSIFATLPKYHHVFKSCNAGSKTNEWCGACPKCLFTHIMLSAFKGVDYADRIIGKPMLNIVSNEGYFDELTGISPNKPFECVGTLSDVQAAMSMIINRGNFEKLPLLVSRFKQRAALSEPLELLSQIQTDHFLNEQQLKYINLALNERVS